mmetsp:Transcript_15606/g.24854  ORF Transcript_15606/g.24854 Transcript_15606/m.24854 type:complete len:524 (+) Transcript_15606:124-1695(+)
MPSMTSISQVEEGVVQIVKNTFITMKPKTTSSNSRRQSSLPANLRLHSGFVETSANAEESAFKVLLSETLSDACTDVTSDDDAASILPISDLDEFSNPSLSPVTPEIDVSPSFGVSPASSEVGDWPYQSDFSSFETIFGMPAKANDSPRDYLFHEPCSVCAPPPMTPTVMGWVAQGVDETPSMSMLATKPKPTPLSKLSSKAVAFKPMQEEAPKSRMNVTAHVFEPEVAVVPDPPKPITADKFSFVIREVVKLLQSSSLTFKVEVCENSQDCSIVLQTDNGDEAEQVLSLAKEALLQATSHSKSVYVMGYCSPNPFTPISQGFEATLGSMENAGQACWHLYKKGFCRHDSACNKHHPTHKVPVRVLVEQAQFKSQPDDALDFKLRVADFVTTVTSALKTHPFVAQAEAQRSASSKCWTIEISPSQGSKACKEELLKHAKEVLAGTVNSADVIYMMGNNAKPFQARPEGFVTVLGDMRAENRACWDLYSLGACRRECGCRWEHPKCLVPVSVLIKPSKKRVFSR